GRAGELIAIAQEELAAMQAHPVTARLWWPRLAQGLEWIDGQIALDEAAGRTVLASEIKGEMTLDGVKVHGRADRIDRRPDGKLVVVDYKTGKPPSAKQVKDGFALQLGTLGLIAAAGGFKDVAGQPDGFEYWSLSKREKPGSDGNEFGFVSEPIPENGKRSGIPRAEFLSETTRYLRDAIERWIKGDEPFTARLNPDIGGYNDYDQLMRLDEWQARGEVGA
ncbi:MAG: PD-(D/E)XK nuclease family protein, partial [Novosphingobium sp.]